LRAVPFAFCRAAGRRGRGAAARAAAEL